MSLGEGAKEPGAKMLRSLETLISDQTNYPYQGLRLPIINGHGVNSRSQIHSTRGRVKRSNQPSDSRKSTPNSTSYSSMGSSTDTGNWIDIA